MTLFYACYSSVLGSEHGLETSFAVLGLFGSPVPSLFHRRCDVPLLELFGELESDHVGTLLGSFGLGQVVSRVVSFDQCLEGRYSMGQLAREGIVFTAEKLTLCNRWAFMKTTRFSTSLPNWTEAGVEGLIDLPDSIRIRKCEGIVGDLSALGWIDYGQERRRGA